MKFKILFAALSIVGAALQSEAGVQVHEWGTFTSLVGSDGKTQNGMYHEDERLPSFVHGFGETQAALPEPTPNPGRPLPPPPRCHGKGCFPPDFYRANVVTQKMETPVLYFYSDEVSDKRMKVNVRFPEGVITETFPAPTDTSPTRPDVIANGDTTFTVDVLSSFDSERKESLIPSVERGNIYEHARAVGSNLVRAGNEHEKFIFYRGLGRFQPRMKITSLEGAVTFLASKEGLPQAAYLVHVNAAGHANFVKLNLASDAATTVSSAVIEALKNHNGGTTLGVRDGAGFFDEMKNSLVLAGLKDSEARAMLNTWNHGYLKTPGLRVLYVLPSSEVERNLPMTISPAPETLNRVFVGRIEVLLDTEERAILSDVRNYRDKFQVQSLGRFAEPILRRVREYYSTVVTNPDGFRTPDPALLAVLDTLVDRASKIDELTPKSKAGVQ